MCMNQLQIARVSTLWSMPDKESHRSAESVCLLRLGLLSNPAVCRWMIFFRAVMCPSQA